MGVIVHFIEGFGKDYEKYLTAFLKRTPAVTASWMLNRCINAGERTEELADLFIWQSRLFCPEVSRYYDTYPNK